MSGKIYTLPLKGYFESKGLKTAPTFRYQYSQPYISAEGPKVNSCYVDPYSAPNMHDTEYACNGSLEEGTFRIYQLNNINGSVLCSLDSCTGTSVPL